MLQDSATELWTDILSGKVPMLQDGHFVLGNRKFLLWPSLRPWFDQLHVVDCQGDTLRASTDVESHVPRRLAQAGGFSWNWNCRMPS
jgi:hypothetical protein